MKKMIKFFTITIVMFSFAASAFAQSTATASATATILTPIAITKDVDMNFGNLAASGTSGTVVLTPAGGRSATGGVTLLPAGTITAASFTVTGIAGTTYSIALPASATINSGVNTMTVDFFNSTPTVLAGGTLTGGTETLLVGATLNVGVAQVAGVYTTATDFDVTVNYN